MDPSVWKSLTNVLFTVACEQDVGVASRIKVWNHSSWKQNSPVRGARSLKSPSNEALACTRDLWGGGPLGGIPSLGVPLGLKGPQGVAVEVTHLWLSIFSKGIRDEGLLFRQLWIKSLQSADTRVRNVILALLKRKNIGCSKYFWYGSKLHFWHCPKIFEQFSYHICSSVSKGMSPHTISYKRMPKLHTVAVGP